MAATGSADALLLHGGALGDCILAYHLACHLVDDPPRDLVIVARNPVHRWLARRGLIADSASADACGCTELFCHRPEPSDRLTRLVTGRRLVLNLLDAPGGVVDGNLRRMCRGRVVSLDTMPNAGTGHIVTRWLGRINDAYGLQPNPAGAPQAADDTRRAVEVDLRGQPGSAGQPLLLIHPGSGGRRKCAPPAWWEQVAARVGETGWRVQWMVGPDEIERDGPSLVSRLERTAPVIYEPDITRAADRVAGADAFVAADSGMAHVAALCGVVTIVWFGPTDPAVWRPVGAGVHVVRASDSDSLALEVARALGG